MNNFDKQIIFVLIIIFLLSAVSLMSIRDNRGDIKFLSINVEELREEIRDNKERITFMEKEVSLNLQRIRRLETLIGVSDKNILSDNERFKTKKK